MDDEGTEHPEGWVLVNGGWIEDVGGGSPPVAADRIDLGGSVVTPGLVNTHHHLYQTLTRTRAQEADLFTWLKTLYPVWGRIDAESEYAAARTGLAELALSGCSTVFDHHYVFPPGRSGLVEAEVQAARELGVRLVASRGSMDLGESDGGLPPDSLVEDADEVLAETERLASLHEEGPGAAIQIAVAPCSPFSVSTELLRQGAELARRKGVRLHTHGSETVEEEEFCKELFGMGPTDYFESTGWLGQDVWMAHCVHMNDSDIAAFARTGTGVAHCPSSNARLAAGIARVPDMLKAGVPVGLGVDGTASNESGELHTELRNALLINRLGAHREAALNARQALRLGTYGGAQVLGRADQIGSIEAGKLADLVLWKMDTLAHSSIADPVIALVFGAAAPVTLSLVNGETVVEDNHLTTVDEDAIARSARDEAQRLARLAAQA
jgi:cytosine/adenosine deaminase-related metal-dependent hydrolase